MMYLIIISTLLTFLNSWTPSIAKWISRIVTKKQSTTNLQIEIDTLQKQLNTLSMKDEFVKYTKLQRELNKAVTRHKAEVQALRDIRFKLQLNLTYAFQVVLTLFCLVLFWTHRTSAVVIMKEEWLSPFANILCWPTKTPGALSLPVWFLVSSTVSKILLKDCS